MAVSMIGPKFYAWDKNGKPLAFGQLFTYQARTNNPKDTYKTEDQITANTNPVILNGEGYADVYLSGSYKMVLKDDKNNEIWTSDPVSSAEPSEWVLCLTANYISSTSFKVNGNFTTQYEEGRRVRIDNNAAEYSYATIKSTSFAANETTIEVDAAIVTTGIVESCISIIGPNSVSAVALQVGAPIKASSIEDLLSKPSVDDGSQASVSGFFSGSLLGGGIFVYDNSMPGTNHNGGTIISKSAVYPANWTNPAAVEPWFDGSLIVGTGCWVRQDAAILNYSMFGAVLDGINAAAEICVIETHKVANATIASVCQVGGVCLLSGAKPIEVSTSTSYEGGFKFLLSVDPTGDIFKVVPEYSSTTLSQSDISIGEFVKNASVIQSLSNYDNSFVVIKSDDTDLIRKGGAIQKKANVSLIGNFGELVYPLTTTFSSISEITISPANVPHITIENFTLEVNGTVDKAYPVRITRNCVSFKSPRYIDSGATAQIPVQQLFNLVGCYDVRFDQPIFDSASKGRVDFNYVITGAYYAKLVVDGLTSFDGWAQLDGNYTRDVTVTNSVVDRVGGHFCCYDYEFNNLTLNRGDAISIAGGGLLVVSNLTITPLDTYATSVVLAAVLIRADYGSEWDGSIHVHDILIDAKDLKNATDITVYGINAYLDSTYTGHDFGRDLQFPVNITTENITLHTPTSATGKTHLQTVRSGSGVAAVGGRVSKYPRNISITNSVVVQNGTVYNQNCPLYLIGQFATAETGTSDIYINNCQNSDPRDFGIDTFDGGQLSNVVLDGISGLKTEVVTIDCRWERIFSGAGNTVKKVRGSVAAISGTGIINAYDCDFSASAFSGTWKGAMFGGVIKKYVGIDTTDKQTGFPNYVEDNIIFAKNVFSEIDAGIRTLTQSVATLETGFRDAAYYQ
tara:strand:- start:10669 stop:13392 length:2724 start_codon:yes stop_codon:yes gene_type:complete